MCGRTVPTFDGAVYDLKIRSRMFAAVRILDKFQSRFCCIIIICLVTCDGMSAKVDPDIAPCVRDLYCLVNVLLYGHLVVSVIIHCDFHVGVFRFFCAVCGIVAVCIACAFLFELLRNVRCVHKGSLSDCGAEITVADLVFRCFFQTGCNAFSIFICLEFQCVSDRISGCVQFTHAVLCFWPSCKGERMGCLSDDGRFVIRHFHRDACRSPCACLEGKCRCIDALAFCGQFI